VCEFIKRRKKTTAVRFITITMTMSSAREKNEILFRLTKKNNQKPKTFILLKKKKKIGCYRPITFI
jgi:hypothetical protein